MAQAKRIAAPQSDQGGIDIAYFVSLYSRYSSRGYFGNCLLGEGR
jgi:hypothetical protein